MSDARIKELEIPETGRIRLSTGLVEFYIDVIHSNGGILIDLPINCSHLRTVVARRGTEFKLDDSCRITIEQKAKV